jgi:hypothetical protein
MGEGHSISSKRRGDENEELELKSEFIIKNSDDNKNEPVLVPTTKIAVIISAAPLMKASYRFLKNTSHVKRHQPVSWWCST